MREMIIQVYYCCHCRKIYEVQELGIYFPKCPFCGKTGPIHRGTRRLNLDDKK